MTKITSDAKYFNMKVPKDLWLFLKSESAKKECAMNNIVVACLEKYKKKIENKLTNKNTDV